MKKLVNRTTILMIIIIACFFAIWSITTHYNAEIAKCNKLKVAYPPHPNTITPGRISMLDNIPLANIAAGKEQMRKHKAIIVGITRDNAQDFSTMVRNIENIGSLFSDYRIFIFENDSSDGTKTALESWKINNPKVDFISKDFHNKKRPSHKFLADSRNIYLDELKDPKYDEFDIVMIIDMDMYHGIDERGIEDSFSQIDQWDAVCSNGITASNGNKMYDIFAFRTDEFPFSPSQWQEICSKNNPNDPWTRVCENGEKYSRGFFADLKGRWTNSNQNKLYWSMIVPQEKAMYEAGLPLIPVHSCFGSMGFYKRQFIKDCRYDSIDNDCEHVEFHRCVREKNNGIIMMNPSQMIRYD